MRIWLPQDRGGHTTSYLDCMLNSYLGFARFVLRYLHGLAPAARANLLSSCATILPLLPELSNDADEGPKCSRDHRARWCDIGRLGLPRVDHLCHVAHWVGLDSSIIMTEYL